MPAPMISEPTPSKNATAYRSSTPVVPAPLVSPNTFSRNVRVAPYVFVRRPQSLPIGLSGVGSAGVYPSNEAEEVHANAGHIRLPSG